MELELNVINITHKTETKYEQNKKMNIDLLYIPWAIVGLPVLTSMKNDICKKNRLFETIFNK